MQEIIKGVNKITQQNREFQTPPNLRFASFQHSKTSEDNIQGLFNMRIAYLQSHLISVDLTSDEVLDVEKYKSGREPTKRFKNIKEFLKDLNE